MCQEPVRDDDDRQLLSAIAEGDEAAFQQFFQRYSALSYSLSLRITGNDHDAEDVVADVFWELWEKSARYNPSKSSPYSYLIMLTRCRALDRRRGATRRQAHPILDWATDGPIDGYAQAAPGDRSLVAEQREMVSRAVDGLEASQRKAIELTFFDGLTHTAAAASLGVPLGTLKGRIRTALERLRHVLQAAKSD